MKCAHIPPFFLLPLVSGFIPRGHILRKAFTCIVSFNALTNPLRLMLLLILIIIVTFCKWRNRGSGLVSDFPKVTKIASYRAGTGVKVGLTGECIRAKATISFYKSSPQHVFSRKPWPILTFPWKTVITVGGRFRVGCVSLHTVNGFDYMFLASSFWGRLPLVIQYNQIISYVNSRLARSQRRFHQRGGENETVFPAPESNLLFSRKRSRVNDMELGKGCL